MAYNRKATQEERKAFADAFNLFEKYAGFQTIQDRQQEDEWIKNFVQDRDKIAGQSNLGAFLTMAVIDYLDKAYVAWRDKDKKEAKADGTD